MDFARIDALDEHRGLSAGLLSRQLARLDWGRLRSLAEGLRDFAEDVRRRVRFGDPDRQPQPEPQAASRPGFLSPEAIRERMLALRSAPHPTPSPTVDEEPVFAPRP